MYKVLISWLLFSIMFLATQVSAAQFTDCMTEQCQSYFKKFKEYNDSRHAMFMLGNMYYSGYGTVKDEQMALKYYRMAGKKGYSLSRKYAFFEDKRDSLLANYNAAVIYLTDEKQDNDYLGLKLLKQAALSGHAESAFKLAMIYVNGEYGTNSISRADKWLALSYVNNHAAMVEVIQQIKDKSSFNLADFPKLTRVIKKVKFSDKSIQAENQSTEKFLSLHAMLDQSLSNIQQAQLKRNTKYTYFPNQQATLGANRQAYYGGHKGPYGTK